MQTSGTRFAMRPSRRDGQGSDHAVLDIEGDDPVVIHATALRPTFHRFPDEQVTTMQHTDGEIEQAAARFAELAGSSAAPGSCAVPSRKRTPTGAPMLLPCCHSRSRAWRQSWATGERRLISTQAGSPFAGTQHTLRGQGQLRTPVFCRQRSPNRSTPVAARAAVPRANRYWAGCSNAADRACSRTRTVRLAVVVPLLNLSRQQPSQEAR